MKNLTLRTRNSTSYIYSRNTFLLLITFNYFVCLPHHLLAALSSSSENKSCSSAHRRQAFYYVYPICFLIYCHMYQRMERRRKQHISLNTWIFYTFAVFVLRFTSRKKITTGTGRSSDDGIVYCRRFMNKAKWWRKRKNSELALQTWWKIFKSLMFWILKK